MGTLRSTTDLTGLVVNGCLLGMPVFDEANSMFMWDDNAFPTGTIDPSGDVTLDELPIETEVWSEGSSSPA
jgi:hypothetical protein